MKTVEEGSQHKRKVRFEDETGQPFVPGSIRWRLTDQTNFNLVLIDWTSVTPASEITIAIPASSNSIINDANAYEKKIITVQSDFGTAEQMGKDDPYQVRNSSAFTSA